jgi:hypothetical protein
LISSTGAVGQVLTKTATSVGWTTISGGGGGGSITTDNTTLISSVTGVYSVSNNISTAGSYLGPIAASVANTTSLINAAATAGQVLTKTATSYAWSNATGGGGGGSILTDNTTLVSSISGVYSVGTNITNAASVVNAAGTVGYVLTKTATSATWQAASGGGGSTNGVTSITLNIVYSNTSTTDNFAWTDSSALIKMNTALTTAANTLPSGWSIGYIGENLGAASKLYLSNSSLNATKLHPIAIRAHYAPTTVTTSTANQWVTFNLTTGLGGNTNSTNGKTFDLTVSPWTQLDNQTLEYFAKGETFNSNSTSAYIMNFGTTARMLRINFLFDTN